MALALKPRKSLKAELKRVARKELGKAADLLLKHPRTDEDVHESRKSVKKAEAIAILLHRAGGDVSARDRKKLHRAKRALSRFRDADAAIQTLGRLQSRFPDRIPRRTSTALRQQLDGRKAELRPAMRSTAGALADAGKTLGSLRRAAGHWAPSIKLSELPPVLKDGYRECRKAMKRAAITRRADDFHAWRKAVKTLWYQLRLVERLVSGLTAQIEEFRELETALGDEHNLAVFRTQIRGDRTVSRARTHVEEVTALSNALEEELRRAAMVLGQRLFRRSPKAFARDLQRRLKPRGTPRRKPAPGTRGRAVE